MERFLVPNDPWITLQHEMIVPRNRPKDDDEIQLLAHVTKATQSGKVKVRHLLYENDDFNYTDYCNKQNVTRRARGLTPI